MPEKSIAEKLLIKAGRKLLLINPPDSIQAKLDQLPESVTIDQVSFADLASLAGQQADILLAFFESRSDLEKHLGALRETVTSNGLFWIGYHKLTSKLKGDINRDSLHSYASSVGLEGVTLISIDEDWSAMRFKRKS